MSSIVHSARQTRGKGSQAPLPKCAQNRAEDLFQRTCALSLSSRALTTSPATAAVTTGVEPEFVRVPDLRLLAGIKRGYAYLKIKDGTFRSITLREPGKQFGVRLVYWPSVKKWLHSLLAQQNPDRD